MGINSKKIIFKVDNSQLEKKFDEQSPQTVLIDLLFDAQSGGETLKKLVESGQLKAKASKELLPNEFNSYSIEYVEEVIEVFLDLQDGSLVRGVSFDGKKEYRARMSAIKKTGRDKTKELMSHQEVRNLEEQGVDPKNAIWATKNHKKAWEYAQSSSIPLRVLLFYQKEELKKPDTVTKPYLYTSSSPQQALKTVAEFKYD